MLQYGRRLIRSLPDSVPEKTRSRGLAPPGRVGYPHALLRASWVTVRPTAAGAGPVGPWVGADLYPRTPPDPSTPQNPPNPQDPHFPDAPDVAGHPLALSELLAAGDIDSCPATHPCRSRCGGSLVSTLPTATPAPTRSAHGWQRPRVPAPDVPGLSTADAPRRVHHRRPGRPTPGADLRRTQRGTHPRRAPRRPGLAPVVERAVVLDHLPQARQVRLTVRPQDLAAHDAGLPIPTLWRS